MAHLTQPFAYFMHIFMKKLFLLIISSFFFNVAIAKSNAIKITNLNANKEKIFKENRMKKLTTLDGRKIKGRFKVENKKILIHLN